MWLVGFTNLITRPGRTRGPHHRDDRGAGHEPRPSGQALREVFGLVVRREGAFWRKWRPWLALVGVVAPLGILLSHVSPWWADGSAIYSFLYVNNWTWAYLESPGARRDQVTIGTHVCLHDLALIGWSRTSGFVLGSLSRRTLWVTATLFCLAVFEGSSWTTTARANAFNAAAFSLTFYRVVYPWLALMLLVLLPAGWGMRRSRRPTALPLLPTLLAATAVAGLTVSAARVLENSVVFGWHMMLVDPGPDGLVGTADDPLHGAGSAGSERRPRSVRLAEGSQVGRTLRVRHHPLGADPRGSALLSVGPSTPKR